MHCLSPTPISNISGCATVYQCEKVRTDTGYQQRSGNNRYN